MWIHYKLKSIYLLLTIGIIGFCCGFALTNTTNSEKIPFVQWNHYGYIQNFIVIFSKNLSVGLLISIVGFITGGLLTCLVCFWNGFLMGVLIKEICNTHINSHIVILLHIFPHAIPEISALLIFGGLGLQGASFYNYLRMTSSVNWAYVPQPILFLVPTILLVIAALLESIISI